MMPTYKPRGHEFRAVRWWGNINDLPSEWLDRGKLTLEPDGTLIAATLSGPAPLPPDGSRYLREHSPVIGSDELWPVETPIFEATHEATQ